MRVPTTGQRAAAARAARLRHGRADEPQDPCPACGAELSRPHGQTRRQALYGGPTGSFHWRCPDCRHKWDEPASGRSRRAEAGAGQAPATDRPSRVSGG